MTEYIKPLISIQRPLNFKNKIIIKQDQQTNSSNATH